MERPGDQVAREGLQRRVVVARARVVVAARVLDLVLGRRQRLLELQEALDGAQLGVVLGDGEQGAQRAGQGVLGRCDLRRVAGRAGGDGVGASLGDRLEGPLLVAA